MMRNRWCLADSSESTRVHTAPDSIGRKLTIEQVTHNDIAVAEGERRRWNLSGNHVFGFVVEVLVVRRRARVADDHSDTRAASGPATTLSVVVRPRWNVTHDHGVEASDVDTHFESWRTRQHV